MKFIDIKMLKSNLFIDFIYNERMFTDQTIFENVDNC